MADNKEFDPQDSCDHSRISPASPNPSSPLMGQAKVSQQVPPAKLIGRKSRCLKSQHGEETNKSQVFEKCFLFSAATDSRSTNGRGAGMVPQMNGSKDSQDSVTTRPFGQLTPVESISTSSSLSSLLLDREDGRFELMGAIPAMDTITINIIGSSCDLAHEDSDKITKTVPKPTSQPNGGSMPNGNSPKDGGKKVSKAAPASYEFHKAPSSVDSNPVEGDASRRMEDEDEVNESRTIEHNRDPTCTLWRRQRFRYSHSHHSTHHSFGSWIRHSSNHDIGRSFSRFSFTAVARGLKGRTKANWDCDDSEMNHTSKTGSTLDEHPTGTNACGHCQNHLQYSCPSVRELSKKHQMDSRRQVVVMLVFVVACFFLLFLPYRVFTIWLIFTTEDQVQSLGMETYYCLAYCSRILIYLHSAINPIAYNLISTKFRRAFMSILLCRGPMTRRHFIVDKTLSDNVVSSTRHCSYHTRHRRETSIRAR